MTRASALLLALGFGVPVVAPAATAAPAAPRITRFEATPETIEEGGSVTLHWRVVGATRIAIWPSIGRVEGRSITVQPLEDTVYRLVARNPAGTRTRQVTVTVVPRGTGPFIDRAKIPAPATGFADRRVRATAELPGASDGTGNFRTVCELSHMAFDDPIVAPGRPGASHLHAFFGNTGTDALSTPDSIEESGNSTCRGGIVNRTAYWVPAMIDTRDGSPVIPDASHFYYKTGYRGVAPSEVQELPEGLRMIAGDGAATGPQPGVTRYVCIDAPDRMESASIPACPTGSQLWQEIAFPQCWDGVHLDAPDHRSHMAYADGGCPASHPVALPEITFNIVYPIDPGDEPAAWRLASDRAGLPPGISSHADWFNGWDPEIMTTFVERCDRAAVDCRSHLLGDGREIF